MSDQAPRVEVLTCDLGPTAAGSDTVQPVGEAPFDGVVTAVTFTPRSTLTGADTNSRTISVQNKGQSGSGSTSVASKAYTSGVNATGSDANAITLSGTAANLVVAAGDVLDVLSTHVGTGLADPGGLVEISVSRS